MTVSFYVSAAPYSAWSHQLSGSSRATPQCLYYIQVVWDRFLSDPFKFTIPDLYCGRCCCTSRA